MENLPPLKTGSLTYDACHARRKYYFGSASKQECDEQSPVCRGQAAQWSFTKDCPNVQRGERYDRRSGTTWVVEWCGCADSAHFRPLCKSCHLRVDNYQTYQEACKWGHLLLGENLLHKTLRHQRQCRACSYARSGARTMVKGKRIRKPGVTDADIRADADKRYAAFMAASSDEVWAKFVEQKQITPVQAEWFLAGDDSCL